MTDRSNVTALEGSLLGKGVVALINVEVEQFCAERTTVAAMPLRGLDEGVLRQNRFEGGLRAAEGTGRVGVGALR